MKRCAVIIGVNRVGGMQPLQAATIGAGKFAEWADSQRIDKVLLTDEEKPVTASDVKAEVQRFVNDNTYDQIIIFFSGHGILKGPDTELWLLSGAPDDPTDAVNLPASRAYARRSTIPHVIFISDACRSIPEDMLVQGVLGIPIFPNKRPGDTLPVVDVFYSTYPGDPSYEVPETAAVSRYKGLYTESLLKGLYGLAPELIVEELVDGQTTGVIRAEDLSEFLKKDVPQAAQKIKITLTQRPDGEILSRKPTFISRFDHAQMATLSRSGGDKFHEMRLQNRPKKIDFIQMEKVTNTLKADVITQIQGPTDDDIHRSLDLLVKAKGRTSFETTTGFSLIGDAGATAVTSLGCITFDENETRHIRIIHPEVERTALLLLSNGDGVPLAIQPGFIGTVVVDGGRVVNVNYTPSKNNPLYRQTLEGNAEIEERRALVATAARFGQFKISGHADQLMLLASYLREYKELDPTLGLYSSYAYYQAGAYSGVNSVYQFMNKAKTSLLYDVCLLASLSTPNKVEPQKAIAPFCPLLSQGWSFLVGDKDRENLVIRYSKFLVPGLWTTFTKEGSELITSDLQSKAIL